jgi:hypothetical protein
MEEAKAEDWPRKGAKDAKNEMDQGIRSSPRINANAREWRIGRQSPPFGKGGLFRKK